MTTAPAGKNRASVGEVAPVLRRILAENGRAYFHYYIMAVACLLAIAGATAFSAWIMRDVIDEIFYKQRADLIAIISGVIFLAFVVRGLATYGQAVILAKIGNNLVARYQQRLFDHLMRLGVEFFADNRSGQLAAQINQNVLGIRELLSITLTAVARDAVTLVALVAVMVSQDWKLSLFAFIIGPPLAFTASRLMRKLRRVTRESVEVNARLLGSMQEGMQGIQVVKAFTMEDQLSVRISALVKAAEARENRISRVYERLTPISESLAGLAVASVIAYAGYRAAYQQQPPGAVFAFITALLLAYDPVRRLAQLQVKLERTLVNARMIYEILDLEPRQGDAPGAGSLAVGDGKVVFDAVSFAYSTGPKVLDRVSFTAAAGKTTAIVGGSGAGKTTLTALLLRFHDLESGTISIDGQDIAGVTKESLRHAIAYVSQQPYLFEGSIRDNIRYGRPDATDAEIEEAARIAHADGFIRQQAMGYDTPIGENGATLSGGQRQRISIARAVVRNAPILVLDEATSALDNESEAQVQAALADIMKDRTTIVIAHRLSTVVGADRIVVLDAGRLAEQGTHRELVRRNGIYARFHQLQGESSLGIVADVEPESTAQAAPKAGPKRERAVRVATPAQATHAPKPTRRKKTP